LDQDILHIALQRGDTLVKLCLFCLRRRNRLPKMRDLSARTTQSQEQRAIQSQPVDVEASRRG